MRQALRLMGVATSPEEEDQLLLEIDASGDGLVDWGEFLEFSTATLNDGSRAEQELAMAFSVLVSHCSSSGVYPDPGILRPDEQAIDCALATKLLTSAGTHSFSEKEALEFCTHFDPNGTGVIRMGDLASHPAWDAKDFTRVRKRPTNPLGRPPAAAPPLAEAASWPSSSIPITAAARGAPPAAELVWWAPATSDEWDGHVARAQGLPAPPPHGRQPSAASAASHPLPYRQPMPPQQVNAGSPPARGHGPPMTASVDEFMPRRSPPTPPASQTPSRAPEGPPEEAEMPFYAPALPPNMAFESDPWQPPMPPSAMSTPPRAPASSRSSSMATWQPPPEAPPTVESIPNKSAQLVRGPSSQSLQPQPMQPYNRQPPPMTLVGGGRATVAEHRESAGRATSHGHSMMQPSGVVGLQAVSLAAPPPQVMAHAVFEVAQTKLEAVQEVAQAKLQLAQAKLAVVHSHVEPTTETWVGSVLDSLTSMWTPSRVGSDPDRSLYA